MTVFGPVFSTAFFRANPGWIFTEEKLRRRFAHSKPD